MVKQPTYLSDHSQITAWFSIPKNPNSTESENPELQPLKELPKQFNWSEISSVLFKNELSQGGGAGGTSIYKGLGCSSGNFK